MTISLDDLDRKLISLLEADARMPAADLGRRAGVARTTVVARLQRLERSGVITGYTVRLGGEAAAEGVHAYVSLAVDPKKSRRVIDRLAGLPELRQLASVSGEFDYVAVLRAPSTQRLDALLDDIGQFDGVLRTMTSVALAMRIDRVM